MGLGSRFEEIAYGARRHLTQKGYLPPEAFGCKGSRNSSIPSVRR